MSDTPGGTERRERLAAFCWLLGVEARYLRKAMADIGSETIGDAPFMWDLNPDHPVAISERIKDRYRESADLLLNLMSETPGEGE